MESEMFKILESFRDNENPEMGDLNGKCYETLSKAECLEELEKHGIDGLRLCRLGNISPSPEYLCKLAYFAKDVIPRRETPEEGEAPRKKKKLEKSAEQVSVKSLKEKLDGLEKQLKEKKDIDDASEYEKAKREVKEEASKTENEFKLRPWETAIILPFDPYLQPKRSLTWVNVRGEPMRENSQKGISAEEAFSRAQQGHLPSVDTLIFQNPQKFVAGQIHNSLGEWSLIFDQSLASSEVRGWVRNGINIYQYIRPFRGSFAGANYDHNFPPQRIFNNSNKCIPFVDFINNTLTERLLNGSIECVGKLGHVNPPHIVAPLTVEPSKPRLCINLMYLNNWIMDIPFSLDTLKDVPRVIKRNAYFTSTDDKSGFDNLFLDVKSRNLVGFQWGGYYFRFLTLPFGFKLSSYIYHTLNLQPVSYIRKHFSIPIFLYIDDRLIEEIRQHHLHSGYECAILANYIVCQILIRLGYCINLDKSVFIPTQTPVFLGFLVDSVHRCFRLTLDKKEKFAKLRDQCLTASRIKVLDLQRLAGRCISFILVVPGAKLYTREMNLAISQGLKSGSAVQVTEELRDELTAWKFLDTWEGKLEWKREMHLALDLFSDASKFKWGGIVHLSSGTIEISDFWTGNDKSLDIMCLEAKALINVLKSIADKIKGHRVDAYVDNQVLINSWRNEGTRSRELNSILKELFHFVLDFDIILNLVYVQSKSNPADEPSRSLQKSDAMISQGTWEKIQQQFGGKEGHSIDLMSLDSNCMKDQAGNQLKHFTPFRTPQSSGVNMFSQNIATTENCYVHPPIAIINPVINFIVENQLQCTVVLPAIEVTPVWLPSILDYVQDALILGHKGQKHVLKYPSKKGYIADKYGLHSNIWAVRMGQSSRSTSYGKVLYILCPGVSQNSHLLVCGDSMVKFMVKRSEFATPMVHISAHGGALISQVHNDLERIIAKYPPKIIFFHAGVNNMSKCFLFQNEYHQISSTLAQLSRLECTIREQIEVYPDVKIILSAIVVTKDGYINARSSIINDYIQLCCKRNKWTFMDNRNISEGVLRDTVHLNKEGEDIFAKNVITACHQTLS